MFTCLPSKCTTSIPTLSHQHHQRRVIPPQTPHILLLLLFLPQLILSTVRTMTSFTVEAVTWLVKFAIMMAQLTTACLLIFYLIGGTNTGGWGIDTNSVRLEIRWYVDPTVITVSFFLVFLFGMGSIFAILMA
ncbi:hypothetical protein F4781DRAFT_429409 [Annulohypoxylon bovei var. microspora]|nr:hypothetical protein F4781DRAFT_429409 [Annulohypoxylon bovei var. microspora]